MAWYDNFFIVTFFNGDVSFIAIIMVCLGSFGSLEVKAIAIPALRKCSVKPSKCPRRGHLPSPLLVAYTLSIAYQIKIASSFFEKKSFYYTHIYGIVG